jgi:hypothetical protein
MNKGRPGDESLAPPDRGVLERYVEPIMAALRACGASPDTADQKPPVPKGQKKTFYKESVKDLIDAGLLKAGTVLQPLRRGLTQTALVLPDGDLRVGEQVFAAVSPAAMAVSGHKSEPGWAFWGAPSGEGGYVPLAALRDRLREDGTKVATRNRGAAVARTPTLASVDRLHEGVAETEAAPAESLAPAADVRERKKPRQFTETLVNLLDAGLLYPGEELGPVRRALEQQRATLRADGRIEVGGEVYGSLSASAVASAATRPNRAGSSGRWSAAASSSGFATSASSSVARGAAASSGIHSPSVSFTRLLERTPVI